MRDTLGARPCSRHRGAAELGQQKCLRPCPGGGGGQLVSGPGSAELSPTQAIGTFLVRVCPLPAQGMSE